MLPLTPMRFNEKISINNSIISDNSPCFIIAEAGVNHGGDLELGKQLVDCAAEAGADAVKFQSFKAEHVILRNIEKAPYQQKTTGASESQFEMLKKLEMSMEMTKELFDYCREKDILFLTTPFDEYSLDALDELNLPAYKVASTDLTNLPFLKRIARKGKPVFLSTGMSYLAEVKLALRAMHPENKDIILLQCSANYPIKDEDANLAVINTYKDNIDVIVGYSDHSVGIGAAPYAAAMGAKVLEKHFTLDKSSEGPDHLASLSPEELIDFVAEVRKVEKYLGAGIKKPSLDETKTRASLQKCLVAAKDIKKGERFTEDNIIAKRTGGRGISPIYYENVIGKVSEKDYFIDDLIENN